MFCPFASTYQNSFAIFKKPAKSMSVSLDQLYQRTRARLPQSNEATGRVTKGQAVQPATPA